jgi:6-pyruvoyl-tetrahydropterin synthase
LKINFNEVQVEKDKENKWILQIEECIEEVFKSILDNTQEGVHLKTEEKIGNIVQAMENYKSYIIDLLALLNPSTPPEVHLQREKEVSRHMENIAQSIKDVAELYENLQLWTNLQEDEKL